MIEAATILLVLFAVVGGIDGVYYHGMKFKLYEKAASRREHWLHTGRAVLFPPAVIILFAQAPGGALLWAGVALLAADFVLMVWDTWEEKASRSVWGGLPRGEYLIHLLATGLHFAALALALGNLPVTAWALASAPVQYAYPASTRLIAWFLAVGGLLTAVQHIYVGMKTPRTGSS
jgi:hypothetical protein